MTHFTGSRLLSFLLAGASVLGVPLAQAQSWSPAMGDFQGGYGRTSFVSATGDSWTSVYYGGMFKKSAGSSTWTPINNGLTDKRIFNFSVVSSVSPYRGYAATRGGGVYKTIDGGANWTVANSGLGCTYVLAVQFIGVAATPTTAATNGIGATDSTDRLLASTTCGTGSGVYLSIDGGASWTLTSGMNPEVMASGITRVNPATGIDFLLAATYDGVYKSTDNGLNWTLSNGAITSQNGSNINAISYLYNGTPAALTIYATESNTGVWKSTDNGANWGTAPILNKITTSAAVVTDGNSNGNLYYPVDGEGIYKSADKGATWTLFASGAALPGGRGLNRFNSSTFYAPTYAGFYQSTDTGVTWTKASTGLPGGYTINAAFDSSGNTYVAAAEGVYKLPAAGGTFQRLGGYNLGYFGGGGHIIVTPSDVPYAITFNLGVFKYDGSNWVTKNTGLPAMSRQGGQLRADPKNTSGLYLGLNTGGMYYSADGGETWTAKNTGLTGNALHIRHMSVTSAIAVIATNDGVYKSVDSGATWTRLAFAAKSPTNVELPIDHIRIDSGNGNIYAAVYQTSSTGVTHPGSGIWKSTDSGATWTQSLAGKQAHDVSIARNASGVTLYAGVWDAVGGGAMQSTDEGATWTPINTGLTNNYIGSFAIAGGQLKAITTLGDGVFAFTPGAATESLNIVPGWNLLGNGMSTPLTVSTAFGDTNKVTTVWKWVPASTTWAFYTPSLPDGGAAYAATKGYAYLTTVAAGEGFWVNAKATFTQPLAGTAVTSASYQTALVPGWNLIATGDRPTPSGFNRTIGTTPPTAGVIPSNLTTLWAWDATKASWYFYAPTLDASGGLSTYITSKSYLDFTDNTLEPTNGFWVNK